MVGLNAITRHLESVIAAGSDKPDRVAVIFLPQPHDLVIYSHLPALCMLASKAGPNSSPIRLVHFKVKTEDKLVQALALPRVGVVGVFEDGANASVIEYVRDRLPAIRAPLLDDANSGQYLAVKIGSSG